MIITVVIAILLAGAAPAFADESTRSFDGCPRLGEGDSGPCVEKLQQYLNIVNSDYDLDPEGDFGQDTRIAVLDFQGRNHLGADGRVGGVTADELQRQVDAVSVGTPTPSDEPVVAVPEARGDSLFSGSCEGSGRQAEVMVTVNKETGFAESIKYELSPATGTAEVAVFQHGAKPSLSGAILTDSIGVPHAFVEDLIQDGQWHDLSLRTNSGYGYPYGVHKNEVSGGDREYYYRFDFWFDGEPKKHCEFVLRNPFQPW